MNGILNIRKEKGWTSQDVCSKLKGILHTKKIGHTGTLDPNAVGVLPVCIGKATKLCSMITDWGKEYEAEWILGKTSNTYDITGEIKERNIEKLEKIDEECIKNVLQNFTGEIEQYPPMFSARKVDGKKLYEYARKGITVERRPKKISVYSMEILELELPRVVLKIKCAKGTYIRSLCHDMGEMLGTGGLMGDLVRTEVGPFKIDNTYTIQEIEKLVEKDKLDAALVTIESMFKDLEKAYIKEEISKSAYNGNYISINDLVFEKSADSINNNEIIIYDKDGILLGIYFKDAKRGVFKPKLFLYENK